MSANGANSGRSISLISRTAEDGLCDTPAILGLSDFFAEPSNSTIGMQLTLCELIRALYLVSGGSVTTSNTAWGAASTIFGTMSR